MPSRRSFLLLSMPLLLRPSLVLAEEAAWETLRQNGAIVLFRHAHAPGIGDPPGFRLGDCSTQRNLDARGRAEARAIGAAFRRAGVEVGQVLSSQWCRARETAELAFPGRVKEEAVLNSFFGNRSREAEATARALAILSAWRGPGALVAVTHQVNIAALTGVSPRSGEGIVVRIDAGAAAVTGRLPPPGQR